jgi:hypothetical protein
MSIFFQPLDKLLSSESKVRILRVLLRAGGPLSGREIARRSRVALLSVQKAMADLVTLEAVDRKETSAQHLYSINEASFLVREGVAPLFAAEARRVEAVFERIRGILSEDEAPEAASAAVFGSAARGGGRAGERLRPPGGDAHGGRGLALAVKARGRIAVAAAGVRDPPVSGHPFDGRSAPPVPRAQPVRDFAPDGCPHDRGGGTGDPAEW